MAEQLTLNQLVLGSSPSRGTTSSFGRFAHLDPRPCLSGCSRLPVSKFGMFRFRKESRMGCNLEIRSKLGRLRTGGKKPGKNCPMAGVGGQGKDRSGGQVGPIRDGVFPIGYPFWTAMTPLSISLQSDSRIRYRSGPVSRRVGSPATSSRICLYLVPGESYLLHRLEAYGSRQFLCGFRFLIPAAFPTLLPSC